MDAPSPDQIRVKDRERLLERMLAPVEFDYEDRELAATLMERLSAEDIAAALVRGHRSAMPQPEELLANTPEAHDRAKADRHRPGFEDTVWFRIAVGRRQNAEPRWILPLLCRRGHITRNEIGAIKVGQAETHFQVPRAIADRFADALRRTASSEDEQDFILIEPAPEGPREAARSNRREHSGEGRPGRVQPRPHRPGSKPGGPGGFKGPRKFAGKPKGKPRG